MVCASASGHRKHDGRHNARRASPAPQRRSLVSKGPTARSWCHRLVSKAYVVLFRTSFGNLVYGFYAGLGQPSVYGQGLNLSKESGIAEYSGTYGEAYGLAEAAFRKSPLKIRISQHGDPAYNLSFEARGLAEAMRNLDCVRTHLPSMIPNH
jgi:hypothetical protein